MANWKKIIVSGSNAHLAQITSSVLTDGYLVMAGAGGALKNSDITLSGGNLNIGSNSIISTGTGSILTGSFSGSFVGDGSGLTGLATKLDISASDGSAISVDLLTQDLTITGTANEIETSAAGTTITIGLPNDVVVSQDLTVNRNLTVLGTASFQHTTNFDVADRFILMASGSNTAGDGGIVVQQGTQGVGETFAYDASNTRWGVTGSFDATQNSFTPEAFMATVIEGGAGQTPGDVVAKLAKKGNIFIQDTEDIWIFS